MAQKRNVHTRKGFNKNTPEDAIDLGANKHIRILSDIPENEVAEFRVGRRGYNDARYIRQGQETSPIHISYPDQATMLLPANQENQRTGFIYFDGTRHWEKLEASTGAIGDYRDMMDGNGSENYKSLNDSQLFTLFSTNSLSTGSWYLLQDFQTIHRITNTNDIHTGTVEPLFLLATSINTFAPRVYSVLFPNDIIEFDYSNRLCEDGTTPRKGKIIYRKDLLNDIECYYDYKEVRFRRYKVTSKQEEVMTSLTASTLDCLLTFSTGVNMALTFFDTNRRLHMQVGEITHDAGELTLTVRKGTGSLTKPLLKYDGSAWTANELANTSGILTNCLIRDAYVFMNYRTFGKEIVNTYSSPVSSTYVLGDGLRYIVDPLDYTDYLTFNGDSNYRIKIDINSSAQPGNNIVFFGNVRDIKVETGSFNLTVRGQVINAFFGPETQNCMFSSDVLWSNFSRECVTSYFGYCRHVKADDHIVNTTLYPPTYHLILLSTPSQCTIACSGNMNAFYSPFIENSGIFLSGSAGGDGRTGSVFLGVILNSLVGWFNANDLIISKELRTTSLYQKVVNNFIKSLNIEDSPTPVGQVKILTYDEEGNIIKSDWLENQSGYNSSVAQYFTHDASGNFIWINI